MSRTAPGAKATTNPQRFFLLDLLGADNKDLCFLDTFIKGIEDERWRPAGGKRLSPVYPKKPLIAMSKKYKGIELTDFLANSFNCIVGSTAFKEAVEAHCPKDTVEFLSFALLDHRGRPYSDDYFLINPLGTFDCLDFKASDIDWSDDTPDEILDVEEHVLDRKKMKEAPQFFRIDRDITSYVLGVELIREMKKRALTNVIVEELEFSDSR